MKNLRFSSLAVFLLFCLNLVAAQSMASGPYAIGAPDKNREPAKVYLPNQDKNPEPFPVVLLLHGYTASGNFINSYFGFSDQVTKRGFILIVPNGLKNSEGKRFWNATDGCCDFEHTQIDDVSYLRGLIKTAISKYHGDPARVYVAGHSNGGFMAYRLACEMSDKIAAIASFAGETFLNPEQCKATQPVSVLQIQALDDDTIIYQGDAVGYPGLAPYPGAQQSIQQWLKYDSCESRVDETIPGLNLTLSIPGPDATAQIWRHCQAGTQVELWTIRSHKSIFHKPHTPFLTQEFTDRVLGFLLSQKKQ